MRYMKRRGASSVSQSGTEEWVRRKSDFLFLSSFLPANGTKAQKSIYPWRARGSASDWTSIIYGISRGWMDGRHGRTEWQWRINRVIAVNSATYTAALHCPHHYFRTTYCICCHLVLVNRLHLRWTDGRRRIDIRGGRDRREGGLKRRNGANNRRNEPPLSFARIACDGRSRRERERERNRP